MYAVLLTKLVLPLGTHRSHHWKRGTFHIIFFSWFKIGSLWLLVDLFFPEIRLLVDQIQTFLLVSGGKLKSALMWIVNSSIGFG